MFSGIGTSYLTGLVIGGSWGFYEGLRNPDGKTMKLRVNRLEDYVFSNFVDPIPTNINLTFCIQMFNNDFCAAKQL